MTWGELIRRLKRAGFVYWRDADGSHYFLRHPDTGRVVLVTNHTTHEVGTGLARRILKDAGLTP